MLFINKFSLDNDVILVHRKLGQELITLEDFINLHNAATQTFFISRDKSLTCIYNLYIYIHVYLYKVKYMYIYIFVQC